MNWAVFHIVSGQAFFSGVVLMIVAAAASTRPNPLAGRMTLLAACIGLTAIVISSTAVASLCYVLASLVTLAWIASRYVMKWRRWASIAVACAWLFAAALELPHHLTPTLSPAATRSITILGDSITAGVGGDETSERWPSVLARKHALDVQDISQMGDTAADALKRAKSHRIDSPVVVVEIGGNDLLGSTSAAQFARDLDALLAHLSVPERQIVMFELPLPPFCHAYGYAQRAVAEKYDVTLIPKRAMLSVLGGDAATLDSIHLTAVGHQKMADCVWDIVGPAFGPRSGK